MHVRLAALAAIAIVAVVPAAYSAGGPPGTAAQAQPTSGFADPVTAPARALDTDLSSSGGTLRRVRCATALPGARCWLAR